MTILHWESSIVHCEPDLLLLFEQIQGAYCGWLPPKSSNFKLVNLNARLGDTKMICCYLCQHFLTYRVSQKKVYNRIF